MPKDRTYFVTIKRSLHKDEVRFTCLSEAIHFIRHLINEGETSIGLRIES